MRTLALTLLLVACAPKPPAAAPPSTPLIEAILASDTGQVRRLLAAGADPDAADSTGYRPFDYAIERDRRGSTRILIEHARAAAPAGSPEARSLALLLAVMRGDSAAVDSLAAVHAVVNRTGYTPLALAARFGERGAVATLLAHGADPNGVTRSRYHTTPLMEASRDGDTAIALGLLAAGAAVNTPDVYGDNALNWAVYFGQEGYVALLLARGADTTMRGQSGETALEIARRMGRPGVIALLDASRPSAR